MEHSDISVDVVVNEFNDYRIGAKYNGIEFVKCNKAFFEKLLGLAVSEQRKIDQATDKALVSRWRIHRIDPMLRAVFRAAGAEFILKTTPPKVIIVEFLDVTNAFIADEKGLELVNAVLDQMAREL
tara:strand:- start:779 stop:1156 length:378 start_codon:yes stop_codon:yes gene_type:complete